MLLIGGGGCRCEMARVVQTGTRGSVERENVVVPDSGLWGQRLETPIDLIH